jgi:hypothetical protein
MAKKTVIPFINNDGVSLIDGYETDCKGLGVINDKELKAWRLIHISSGLQLGRFRTRKVALRAAEIHNEIDVDFTMTSEQLRAMPDFEAIARCSVAACAVAVAEDEALRFDSRISDING